MPPSPAEPLDLALLEPYCKGSHAAWARGYAASSRHRVDLYDLPGIHWKWRMCHAPLTLARRLAGAGSPPQALLCSSMVDLATLRGLLPPGWPRPPTVLYFHENQLTYPLAPGEGRDLHFAWIQVVSCLAAEAVVFNSAFHRDDFLGALPAFLRSLPDHSPRLCAEEIEEKSTVIAPGVATEDFARAAAVRPPRTGPLRLLWNHRWEADKEPLPFLRALVRLAAGETPFQVVLAGAGADRPGPAATALIDRLGKRVVHRGLAAAADYPALVASCDVAVSTARHDFYGIATVEAMAAGLLPLLPRRQNYPALLPPEYREECLYDRPGELPSRLQRWAERPGEVRRRGAPLAACARRGDRAATTAALDRLLAETALRPPPPPPESGGPRGSGARSGPCGSG